jgi:hypothetical protein
MAASPDCTDEKEAKHLAARSAPPGVSVSAESGRRARYRQKNADRTEDSTTGLDTIDKWRAKQRPIPNVSDAIRNRLKTEGER